MRICALPIFASLALPFILMDRVATAEDRRSQTGATAKAAADMVPPGEGKAAFTFAGVA